MGWRRLTIALLVVVECGLLLVIIPFPGSLRKRQAQKLLTLPADKAQQFIKKLEELPAEFIPALVALLDHDDRTLATVSRRRLVNALQTWRENPIAAAHSHVAPLAKSLRSRADEFGRSGKQQAARVAEAILNWPLPPDGEAVAVIDDARRVLALRPQTGALPLVEVSAGPHPDPLLAPLDSMARFPGGGVPMEPQELPDEARSLPPPQDLNPRQPGEPRLLEVPRTQPREPPSLPSGPARRILPFEKRPDLKQAPPRQPLLLPEATDPLVITDADSDIQLVRALRSRQQRQRERVKSLLEQRGFGSDEFDLANRLHDPDPLVRMRLIADLPSARRVNPMPWLFLLAEDPDRRVRAAAISTLSTNPRRSVENKLVALEKTERDKVILAQLRDAIKRRRSR